MDKQSFNKESQELFQMKHFFVDLPLFTLYFKVLIWKFRVLKFNAWNSHFKFMASWMPEFWSYVLDHIRWAAISRNASIHASKLNLPVGFVYRKYNFFNFEKKNFGHVPL